MCGRLWVCGCVGENSHTRTPTYSHSHTLTHKARRGTKRFEWGLTKRHSGLSLINVKGHKTVLYPFTGNPVGLVPAVNKISSRSCDNGPGRARMEQVGNLVLSLLNSGVEWDLPVANCQSLRPPGRARRGAGVLTGPMPVNGCSGDWH